ncbi:MAG: ribosome maturation factor RimM [Actinomycetota bacterium]
MIERPPWVAVGRITRTHGVKGEVAVLPLSDIGSRFEPGSTIFLDERQDRPLTVASSRPHRQRLLVAFHGVEDRTAAEELRGRYLFVPSSSAPPLPEGKYWAHDLIGCEVRTEEGRLLGTVGEVIHGPANDVWVARSQEGELLIPALKDVVNQVDTAGRRIVVREVPGLTTP